MKKPSTTIGRKTSHRIQLSSIAALGALGLTINAAAQGVEDDPIDAIEGISSYEILPDDTLLITLESGETLTLTSDAYVVIGDQVFLRESGAALVQAAIQGGVLNAGLLAAAAGLGAFTLADELSDDDGNQDGSDTDTTPPVFTSDSAVSVSENTTTDTVIYDADATDTQTVTYSLSGADSELFTIDSATGEVTFVAAPDFETPGDDGDDGVFNITITASDGTNESSLDVAITLVDLNDEAPVFTSADSADAVAETTTDTVYTAAVTDADSDDSEITFSLAEGGDNAHFSIDATTGEVTLNDTIDFEDPADANGDNIYNIQIIAADGDNQTTHDVAITITDGPDLAPVFTTGTTVSVNEGESDTGYTPSATPDLDGSAVTYEITGGADQALFELDASGQLQFVDGFTPDYEQPADEADDETGASAGDNVYEVEITARDEAGNESAQIVRITIDDVAYEGPVFTSEATVSMDEGETLTGIIPSAVSDVPGEFVGIDIVGGADANLFQFDEATGQLKFSNAPDHEAPRDSGDSAGDNVYEVQLRAEDNSGNVSFQTVLVTVNDVADDAPVFTSGTTVSVDEGETETGYTAQATPDVDGTDIEYSIVGGRHESLFTIDEETGELSFIDAPDYETAPTSFGYLHYAVYDALDNSSLDADFEASPGLVSEDPASLFGAVDGELQFNEAILVNGESTGEVYQGTVIIDGITMLVTFDAANGQIIVRAPSDASLEDFDWPDTFPGGQISNNNFALTLDNEYEVEIEAYDGTERATQIVTVTVNDLDDEAPVFTSATTVTNIPENETDVVYTAQATDPDTDDSAITYALASGGDNEFFSINETTGEVTLDPSIDHDTANDANGDYTYEIQIIADDGENTSTHDVSISITDAPDEDPVLTSGTTASIDEGETVTDYTPAADADVDGTTVTYSIVGGAHGDLFEIDSATGKLAFKTAPDYETSAPNYAYQGYASYSLADGTLESSFAEAQTTYITEDPNSPVGFVDGQLEYGENVLINGQATGEYYYGTVEVDGYTAIVTQSTIDGTFRIYVPADLPAAEIDWPDRINQPTLEAYTLFPANEYQVEIEASDGANSSTQTVLVTVNDIDEDAPSFTNSDTTADLNEHDASSTDAFDASTVVFDANAVDPDGANPSLADDGITYALADGGDNAYFTIDENTGEVTWNSEQSAPDHENPADANTDNNYNITITATDGDNKSTDLDVTITVQDVSETAPQFISGDTASMDENETETGYTADVVTDVEDGDVNYSIAGGVHAELFEIDPATGELSFITAPDHEAPLAGWHAWVHAVWSGSSLAGAPTLFSPSDNSVLLTEDGPPTIDWDGVLEVGDTILVDGEDLGLVFYGTIEKDGQTLLVARAADDSAFYVFGPSGDSVIEADLNGLSLSDVDQSPLTLPGSNIYQVEVKADDGSNDNTQRVTITVNDTADDDPIFTSGTTASMAENETATGYTAQATPDVAGDTITYSIVGGLHQDLFTIDATTGELSFKSAPDHEASSPSHAYLMAAKYLVADFSFIEDVTETEIGFISEDPNSNAGAVNGTLELGELILIDGVATGEAYQGTMVLGGITMILTQHPSTGELYLRAPWDADIEGFTWPDTVSTDDVQSVDFVLSPANEYEVEIKADDGSNSSTQTVTITVTDELDHNPIFTSGTTASMDERETDTGHTAQATADLETDGVTYAITGGAHGDLFMIDENTGELTFNAAPDHEAPPAGWAAGSRWEWLVDNTPGTPDSVETFSRPWILTESGTTSGGGWDGVLEFGESMGVSGEAETFEFYGTLEIDGTTYIVTQDSSGTFFTVYSPNGTVIDPDDFAGLTLSDVVQAPLNIATTNEYEVEIAATDDSGYSSFQTVTITVEDIADTPPVFTSPNTARVDESEEGVVYTIQADPDVEGDDIEFIKYDAFHGDLFEVDSESGEVKFVTAPDFESAPFEFRAAAYVIYSADRLTPGIADGYSNFISEDPASNPESSDGVLAAGESVLLNGENFDGTYLGTVIINGYEVLVTQFIEGSNTVTHLWVPPGTDLALDDFPEDLSALTIITDDYQLEQINEYAIFVGAENEGRGSYRQVIITVEDIADTPPVFTSPTTASVDEGETDTVYTAQATADLETDGVTYAITGGAHGDLFVIDPDTGELTFKSASVYYAAQGYIQYSQTSGEAGSSFLPGDFYMAEDPASPIGEVDGKFELGEKVLTNGHGADRYVGTVEIGGHTMVVTITNSAYYINVPDGIDADEIVWPDNFSELSLSTEPYSLEPSNDYIVEIEARDDSGYASRQTVTITVNDAADEAPVFTSDPDVSMDENQLETGYTPQATPDVDGTDVTYAITGGADQALFELDDAGQLVFKAGFAPDYEQPADQADADSGAIAGDNIYEVEIEAKDDTGLTSTQLVTITVEDTSDEDPVFTSGTTFSVTEGETETGYTAAADPDVEGATIEYEITGGDSGFSIDPDTGVVTFDSAPDYSDTGNNTYQIEVTATELTSTGGDGESATQTVTFTVTEDTSSSSGQPQFTSSDTSTVNENIRTSGAAYIAAATDPDGDDSALEYSLDASGDYELFNINSETGRVSFKSSPDYESPSDGDLQNDYQITVIVTDGAGQTASQDVTIYVEDQDPELTSAVAVQVNENTEGPFYTATAALDEGDTTFTFAIDYDNGPDAHLFSINRDTGELSFVTPPDFENPLDSNTNNYYGVPIIATAADGRTVTMTIFVQVLDVEESDEGYPIINAQTEYSGVEGEVRLFTFTTYDPDAPNTNLSLNDFELSGLDGDLFEIVQISSGETWTFQVRFENSPDHENPRDDGQDNTYNITLTVTDRQGQQSSQDIEIEITDKSESGPVINFASEADVKEGETGTGITPNAIPDIDGDDVSYSIAGGTHADLFELDASTGELKFKQAPDYDTPSKGYFTSHYIQFEQSSGPGEIREIAGGVSFIGESEQSAMGSQDGILVPNSVPLNNGDTVSLNGGGGLPFYGYITIDGIDMVVVYITAQSQTYLRAYIPSDVDLDSFVLPNNLGAGRVNRVTFTLPDSHEYAVNIEARDGSDQVSTQMVIITVDEDPNEPNITSDDSASIDETVDTATAVYTVTATDADSAQSDLEYSLAEAGDDNDNDLFDIDPVTGAVTFKESPDHEDPDDYNTDNTYNITVIVTDEDDNSVSQDVTITVNDITDNAPVFNTGNTVSVIDGETGTELEPSADPDVAGETVTYDIVGGAHGHLFQLDDVTNELQFISAPDVNAPVSAYAYDSVISFSSASPTATITENAEGTRVITEDLTSSAGTIDGVLEMGEEFLIDGNSGGTYFGVTTANGYDLLVSSYEENGVTYYEMYVPEGVNPAALGLPPMLGTSGIRNISFTLPETNDYQVQIEATSEGFSTTQLITITVEDGLEASAATLSGFSLSTIKLEVDPLDELEGTIVSTPIDPTESTGPVTALPPASPSDFAPTSAHDDGFVAAQMQLDMSDALDGL